ncbi:MAG: T9SS type A sorting domain-containing protein [Flavobacteriales bacterium]|nr:T9SS type A sorting domain-containing protein [Flavobacteriales bacterium]MCB9167288.1 T9SS type A sorting domain-containing protein [Flavobacteriales bacterium]
MSAYRYFGVVATLAGVLCTNALSAQDEGITCGTDDPALLQALTHGDPHKMLEIEQSAADLEAFTQHFIQEDGPERGGNTYVIPVVFHIIHNNGPENISDEQVEDAIRVLNNDYNKLNDDWDNVNAAFLGIVADVGITFRLAQKDPNGNCTKGITRTQSELTYDGTQDMKDLIQWPRNKYLNIWVAASANGAAGYALYPSSVSSNWAAGSDGIVVLHDYVGSIGTSQLSHSRTLTHEVGHWINLSHTWGSTNDPGLSSNCGSDDNVSDTPNTIGWTTCNINGSTCGSLDNVENYMEYSYCSKMFTEGQKARMIAALNSGTAQRNQLWQPANLSATGTDGNDILCAADFNSDVQVICEGGTVNFHDLSYNGVTDRTWDLPGGTPSTSSDADPVVTYSTPGLYAVSLTAGNGNSTVDIQRNDYILVLPAIGQPDPFMDDLESATSIPNNNWMVNDPGQNGGFTLTGNAGYSGTHSIKLNNSTATQGDIDELLSTSVDMSAASSIDLSFRYAFARKSADNDDVLRIYVSNDCGSTWSMRKQLHAATTLATVGNQISPFTPSGPNDWQEVHITNISAAYHVSDLRFKFWFQNDGGNNLFLDDVNINGTPVGIADPGAIEPGTAMIVPNPSRSQADLVLNLHAPGDVVVDVVDVAGRIVRQVQAGHIQAGSVRVPLPVADLTPGSYIVHVACGGRPITLRLTRTN